MPSLVPYPGPEPRVGFQRQEEAKPVPIVWRVDAPREFERNEEEEGHTLAS